MKALILFAGALWVAASAQAVDFFVAPNGNDAALGSSNQPFATLEAARDTARKAAAGPHRIWVEPGDYYLPKTLQLDARDSGLTVQATEAGKATLYGGKLITGWRRDGEKFWCADLSGVKEGAWDFRVLVVDGQMAEQARMPETGALEYLNSFDVAWLSSVGGGWARPPTQEEYTRLRYRPQDVPVTFDARNAELRLYHMWNESRVGVITNDAALSTLIIQKPEHPLGAFGVKRYVIYNTREGMTRPGQWYLDRSAGRLEYWPLPGQDMATVKVVAPTLERIIGIVGSAQALVENVNVRGLVLQATATPLKPAGFGARSFDGALGLEYARHCVLENLEILNVGGQGILATHLEGGEIRGCQVHHTGGCAIRISGAATAIVGNHLHHVGLIYPSAEALVAGDDRHAASDHGFSICRNEIHDASYCGIDCRGSGHVIEENLIYRVMREVSDGGAIYGMMRDCTLKGNLVRDVAKTVDGYGVSSFYLDESSENCVVEHNVSLGVTRPTQNHIACHITIRDNVFMAPTNMELSFQSSRDCVFSGNTLYVPGMVTIDRPPAIALWTNNLVFRNGVDRNGLSQAFTISEAMPAMTPPARRPGPIVVQRVSQPPTVDGTVDLKEWPGKTSPIGRETARWEAGGLPEVAQFSHDDKCLYVAVRVVLFDVSQVHKGSVWGRDDGVELSLAGRLGTFVLRGFASGECKSVTDAGVSDQAASQLAGAVQFAARTYGQVRGDWKSGWSCEWAIPFAALGLQPAPGMKLPFNVGVYRTEDQGWRCLEGTLGQTWKLDQAAVLQLK